jgi:hypothetical protein
MPDSSVQIYSAEHVRKLLTIVKIENVAQWLRTSAQAVNAMKDGERPLTPAMQEFCHRVLVDVPRLRALYATMKWSQRRAAVEAKVPARQFRAYCTGELRTPKEVWDRLENAARQQKSGT